MIDDDDGVVVVWWCWFGMCLDGRWSFMQEAEVGGEQPG